MLYKRSVLGGALSFFVTFLCAIPGQISEDTTPGSLQKMGLMAALGPTLNSLISLGALRFAMGGQLESFDATVGRKAWQIVDPLKHPWFYEQVGAQPPLKFLFHCSDGRECLNLARAISQAAGVDLVSLNGRTLERFKGWEGLKEKFPYAEIFFIDHIEDLFADKEAPDEVGLLEAHSKRKQRRSFLDDWKDLEDTVLIFGSESLDGFEDLLKSEGILPVEILAPDYIRRIQIVLDIIDDDDYEVDSEVRDHLGDISSRAEGLTCSEMASAINNAALDAARRRKSCISFEMIMEAIDQVWIDSGRDLR